MKMIWNLDDLFKNKKEFNLAVKDIKNKILDIKKYENTSIDENNLFDLLNKKWEIKELINNILVYGSLKYYKNVKSERTIKLKKDAENFSNEITSELSFIDSKILALGKEKIKNFIKSNSKLKIYEHSLNNLFRLQEHIQSNDVNIAIKDNYNLINEQIGSYNNLLRDIKYGTIQVDDETVELNSTNYAKYISSRKRITRKDTYLTVNQSFKNHQDEFANILDLIYDYRINTSKLEKYDSVLDKVLFEENIDSKIINSLIKSINNNIYLIQDYLKTKAEYQEIDDPHLYDFSVPLNKDLKIKYSFEEAIEIIKNALKPLGKKYQDVIDVLLNGHIDATPNKNKHQSITFSWHTYSFMNFRGSYGDLKNMIHELGHIVNYYLSKQNQPYIYEDSSIFVGETASLINEILLNRYLYENAKTKEEKIFFLSKEIENYFTTVFKQTMYTEFENDLYQTKQNQKLTADLLSQKYENIIKKYYGNDIIYDSLSNIEWTRLGHLYRWSYYPYKYATGLLIASNVVNSLLNDKSLTVNEYINFLSSGSCMYSLELLKLLNIDLTNTKAFSNGLNVLSNDISEFKKVLQK